MANWATAAALGDSSTPEWQERNLAWIEPVKGQRWQVYKPAAAQFEGLLKDLINLGYNPTSSGGYNYRNIRGGDQLSQHAFGTAIDMNSLTNALGQPRSDIPQAAELAKKWGLEWGGNWKDRPDPMHFEYTGAGGGDAADLTPEQQWVAGLWQHAQNVASKTGVDPRLIMAQTALETGYGKSVPNNAYFGVKGKGSTQNTLEFINGKMTPVQADFRAYENPEESFQDYGQLLMGSRYAGVRAGKTLEEQIAAMGKSGYATDPDYASKLLKIAQGIPEGGYGGYGTSVQPAEAVAENNSPYALPKTGGKKEDKQDKYQKAASAAFGGFADLKAPVMGAGGNAPQLPTQAPMPMDAMPIVSGPAGGSGRDDLALLMQRLNTQRLWG